MSPHVVENLSASLPLTFQAFPAQIFGADICQAHHQQNYHEINSTNIGQDSTLLCLEKSEQSHPQIVKIHPIPIVSIVHTQSPTVSTVNRISDS